MMLLGTSRLRLSIVILFVLALLMYLPTWMEEEPTQKKAEQIDALRPAYRAKNLTTTLYNEQGQLNHRVFATTMEHYDQLGFVLFTQPEYTLYTDNASAPWLVTAQEGTLYTNDIIQLDSNVEIVNQSPDDFVEAIQTEFIEINLNSKKMTSDQPVIIRGLQYVINSNGFNANLETQQYELIDHVQTVYSPGNQSVD